MVLAYQYVLHSGFWFALLVAVKEVDVLLYKYYNRYFCVITQI